ncbi:hypothetical protein JL12_00905 [Gallibacterium anatis 10672-6]|uniref:glycosyltransferase n=1 Tax=Gallibacterium anatis TaxID=750 RepID=UPI000531208C|nr:glycosyltransferase [Gallibacterium anatis]KGQ52458.1 hypothetical protein JL12_00905 [Gallibacterium anatis 10672-6]
MRVLLLTVRADHGGGPRHVDLIINNISSNYDVYVGCPCDAPYYNKWVKSVKVKKIYELPHRKFSIAKFWGLYKFIKINNISIVHSHGKGAGVYSRLLKIFCPNLKIVHTLHGFHIEEYRYIKKKLYIFIEKILSIFTNKFINVSDGEKNICLSYGLFYSNKSEVIYNGIETFSKIEDAKRKIHLHNKIIITTISRFDYPKNMNLAYVIAKKFSNNKNIIFLWIGDGKDKEELENRAKRENANITFIGFTKNIPLYLSATDIYLSTSRWEGLPYALIEAQAIGIPIIATNVVGNKDVVTSNLDGFLFNNEDEAYNYIEELIKNKNKYECFVENSKINYKNKFDISVVMSKIEKIYNELIIR